MANGMNVMTPRELLDLLSGSNMNGGKAGARLSRGSRAGNLLPRAQREFLEAVKNTPRRPPTTGVVHPEHEAGRVGNRRNKDEDLSPVELAWLQRLPLDPAAVTFDDAVQLAALAGSISKMKTPASYRLVESVWRPVKALHDERLAKAQLEKARAPLPDLPAVTTRAVAEALAEQHPGISQEALLIEARAIVDPFAQERQRNWSREIENAERQLKGLEDESQKRAATKSDQEAA